MDLTVTDVIDTMTKEQRNKLYYIVGDILTNAPNIIYDTRFIDFSFLTTLDQVTVAKYIIEEAIKDQKNDYLVE